MCMEKKEKEVYDFIPEVRSSINGLIDRLGMNKDDGKNRVLITMAADYSTGETNFTGHGREELIAVTFAVYMRRHKIEGMVKSLLETFDKEGLKFSEEEEVNE